MTADHDLAAARVIEELAAIRIRPPTSRRPGWNYGAGPGAWS